tara:strand:- start:5233 stop:5931 length:699 start_codon:yes stop_codon:yes gene_type:complete
MVNVNTVYQTVLLILNQQQRGYITPDEFNKIATQAQLTMFEAYASDLNQQYRLPDNDTEYADRVKNIQQKLQFFQRVGSTAYVGPQFKLTTAGSDVLYRLGSVFYKNIELSQYSQRNEITQLLLSPLTQPTEKFPIYLYENDGLYVYPTTIQNDITFSYLAKPRDVVWGFTTGAQGQYLYASGTSVQFDLDVTEQDELIMRILAYAGVIIQDPTIIQTASQAVANQDNNEKQ